MTEIKQCTCSHAQQDELYGKGNRLHNKTEKGLIRCTVCNNTKVIK